MWIKKLHEQGQKENKKIENTFIKRGDIAQHRLWTHKISFWERQSMKEANVETKKLDAIIGKVIKEQTISFFRQYKVEKKRTQIEKWTDR